MPADSFGRLVDVCTEDWWVRILRPDGTDTGEAEAFTIDIARLRREGAPLPDWLQNDDLEAAQTIGAMTHNWLVLDGRHYDASCPEGAAHFFEMPFFANQIARLRSSARSPYIRIINIINLRAPPGLNRSEEHMNELQY